MTNIEAFHGRDKQHVVHIRLGSSEVKAKTGSTYAFDTNAELKAFLLGLGVGESDGWLDYEQLDPEDECPLCHNGTVGAEGGRLVCRGECGNIF
jgi:hypothetical protein